MTAIDADGHVLEPESAWLEHLDPALHHAAPRFVTDNQGRARLLIAGEMFHIAPRGPDWPPPPLREGGVSAKARLEDMDSEGIDTSILFPSTGLYLGGVQDPTLQTELCRAYNEWLAGFCAADPSRLVGVALVPQRSMAGAAEESRRCIEELGFRGVMLRPNPVGGSHLDDPYWSDLWSLLEGLGAPLLLHEGTTGNVPQSGGDRYDNFLYRHACSHPHEQQMACMELIMGGVLERHPGLRVAFLESGCGWVPYWLERLDEHLEEWGHASAPLELRPSEYFSRQCFVSCEPDERTLPAVVDQIGDESILFATDYPHPDGIFPGVVDALASRSDIGETTKRNILRENARRLFSLA